MNGNGEFGDQIKNNIESIGYRYALNDPFRYETKKMDWLQTKFKCCESCCINKRSKCGARIKTVNGLIVYTQNCLNNYEEKFSSDIIFLCTFSLVASLGLFIITISLLISYKIIRRNYNILMRASLYNN